MTSSSNLRVGVWCACTLVTAALPGCGSEPVVPEPAPEPMIFKGTHAEGGATAFKAAQMAAGYRLAVDMLNEQGGLGERPVVLELEDDRGDPATSRVLYAGFVTDDSVDAVVAPFGPSVTAAAAEITELAGWPLIATAAAAPSIWAGEARAWTVQMAVPARAWLQGSVEVAVDAGATQLALFTEETAIPQAVAAGVREAAQEAGLAVLIDSSYPSGEADFASFVTAASDSGADFLVSAGYRPVAVELARAVELAGYEPLMMSLGIGPADPTFPDDAGTDASACVMGHSPWAASVDTHGFLASNNTFVQRYTQEHGVAPGYHAALGFGAIELLAEAVSETLTEDNEIDRVELRDYLFGTATETILGPFSVLASGSNAGAQNLLSGLQIQWQDDGEGNLVQRIVHPESHAEAEACPYR